MSIRRFVVRIGAFVFSAMLIYPGRAPRATADELPTAEQLVDQLRLQIPRFKNHYSVVLYEDRVLGQPTEWWRASLYADEFGRVLSLDEKGLRNTDGFHPRAKHSWIYNGETYMMIDFTYDRRLGPLVGAGKLIHASYVIPPPGDSGTLNLSVRGALREIMSTSLLFSLQKRLEKKEPILISWLGDPTDGLVQIAWDDLPPAGTKRSHTWVADMNKGGAVVAEHQTNSSGVRDSDYEAEYEELPPGSKRWIATKGISRLLLPLTVESPDPHGRTVKDVIPARESRFELLAYKNDDPDFTDGVFTVLLPAGTYISDGRIQRDYRLQSDRLIPAQIPEKRKPLFRAWLHAKNEQPGND
jgi:hypothetical protein